ncbi:MAG: pyrimidine-nucleoside phosphorylase [Oscillospiraceae bacterium]|nr:pyrimidine-nucleoside phosphorylase [Oscillospiraceae bacterium]
MNMYDIITKKKSGLVLSEQEIRFFIDGFTKGEIPDYQASALLMAVCFQGMNEEETATLTDAMLHSGDMADLSSIPGIKVDKHSTGGVGDKTSMIIGPIAAACGVPVAKMSGRGLGHTGGTVDKLEAIPGLQTAIDSERFTEIVRSIGISIIGQSGNIAPADKKLYALRDVTATVDSIPLIASSIMSKKLAAGSDAILLDVKTGSGAFMKTFDDSIALAQAMVSIGIHSGRRMMALVTDMDVPLGSAIGNALEVQESIDTLQGKGPDDLSSMCIELASYMLLLADAGETLDACRLLCQNAISNGKAFDKLCAMVEAQGGDTTVLHKGFEKAAVTASYTAQSSGYITHLNAESCGMASLALGAGRETLEDSIDYSAGIVLLKKTGDYVAVGDEIAIFHTSDAGKLPTATEVFSSAISIGSEPPAKIKTIQAVVSETGVDLL